MRKRLLLAIAAASIAAVAFGGIVLATASSGVTTTSIGSGHLSPVNFTVKTGDWMLGLRTKGVSDVIVTESVLIPGGTFGWHSHPGPSLVIVKSGTLSVYHAPDCSSPENFGPGSPLGSTFVDQGHDLHVVRNNTTGVDDVYVVSFVPAGFLRRIDEDNPNPSVS